jgi:hypothetical protein
MMTTYTVAGGRLSLDDGDQPAATLRAAVT